MITLRWNQAVVEQLLAAVTRGITRATVMVHTRAKLLCHKAAKRIRRRNRRNKKYRIVYIGSRPGEPPQMRTRLGVRSIAWELDREGLVGKVGVKRNAVYMLYLETGTRRVQPRPWLVRAFDETRDMAIALIQAEVSAAP